VLPERRTPAAGTTPAVERSIETTRQTFWTCFLRSLDHVICLCFSRVHAASPPVPALFLVPFRTLPFLCACCLYRTYMQHMFPLVTTFCKTLCAIGLLARCTLRLFRRTRRAHTARPASAWTFWTATPASPLCMPDAVSSTALGTFPVSFQKLRALLRPRFAVWADGHGQDGTAADGTSEQTGARSAGLAGLYSRQRTPYVVNRWRLTMNGWCPNAGLRQPLPAVSPPTLYSPSVPLRSLTYAFVRHANYPARSSTQAAVSP